MEKIDDSDEQLMRRVRNGHRDCLSTLIRRHASPVLTFLQRMAGDGHVGEELFQEVFLLVWSKRNQYRFPRNFRAWLYAIAVNRCRLHYRQAKSRQPAVTVDVPAVEALSNDPGPLNAVIAAETSQLVEEAVATLPDRQRSVMVLRVWNGLSYAEIADTLGCSEGAARSHMHLGLANVRQFLEPRLHNA